MERPHFDYIFATKFLTKIVSVYKKGLHATLAVKLLKPALPYDRGNFMIHELSS